MVGPESALLLNGAAAAVVMACDGCRDIDAVVDAIAEDFDGVEPDQVRAAIAELTNRGCLQWY